jgi:Ca2+-binding EF-hand superfamily protein
MKKAKVDKNQKIQQAVYKFRFSKDQQQDLKTSFDIFDKNKTGLFIYN